MMMSQHYGCTCFSLTNTNSSSQKNKMMCIFCGGLSWHHEKYNSNLANLRKTQSIIELTILDTGLVHFKPHRE